ncbi:DUF6053 domain-containing protein [Lysobacter enzymogenes]|uniref:DUF6053 domain-containing protein n=1 Tax=Lysobacter enzymogenes TaxID=69 RepID=UPI00374A72EE
MRADALGAGCAKVQGPALFAATRNKSIGPEGPPTAPWKDLQARCFPRRSDAAPLSRPIARKTRRPTRPTTPTPSSLSEALQARRLQSTAARLRPTRSRKRRDSRASLLRASRFLRDARPPCPPWPRTNRALHGPIPVTASLPSRAPSWAQPRSRSPAIPGDAPCAAPAGAPDRIERVRLADVPCRGRGPASQVLHRRGCFVACDAFPGPRSAPSLSVCCRRDVPSPPQAAIVANTGLLH